MLVASIYMVCIVCQALFYGFSILIINLWEKYQFYSDFTEEGTGARKLGALPKSSCYEVTEARIWTLAVRF